MQGRIKKGVITMKDIRDYKDLYATFMRLKDSKAQQEYTVTVGKGQVKRNGSSSRK